ncbi:MAG: biotin--[acetyl-CoA-carboxylase] ligase [Mediterranea sp.]|jgi:BirA family biotin operon repressor/biotin-[acetyl-CoA-carboxylase] ligase|nr:biotin--[acetyl-CoA-carboxylase] ligase [Mediterranea sp.]
MNEYGLTIIQVEETDSTNRYLTQLCQEQEVPPFTIVQANKQTQGKGQRGTSWESEPGKNLTFSFVLYPSFIPVAHSFLLSQIVALSIKEIMALFADDFSIKWSNDIYWRDRKICGILIENILSGNSIDRCICGIGLNVNQEEFLSDAPNPISLKQITGKEHDLEKILSAIVIKCFYYYTELALKKESFPAELNRLYNESLYRNEGIHPFKDAEGEFDARIVRVLPEGKLLLEDTEGKERSYWFKEVNFCI